MSRRWLMLCLLMAVAGLWASTVLAADAPAAAATGHSSIGERMARFLRKSGLPDEMTVFLISTLPIVELRGSIPVGTTVFHMNVWKVFLLSVVGNMLPVPFILWFLGPISRFFMRFGWGKVFFDWLLGRARRKSVKVEEYETLGLTIFVAIPLPATGGWTGAMAAFVMGMRFHHALVSILAGVLIAGVIVTTLCLMGWIGAIIAGIALCALAWSVMASWLKKEEKKEHSSPNTEH